MIVRKEVNKLSEVLNGKKIITAHHGECFGEYAIFGYPRVYLKPLSEIPKFEINKNL